MKLFYFIAFFGLYVYAVEFPRSHEYDKNYWLSQGQQQLSESLNKEYNRKKAKNVIFFLGDGLGLPVVTSGRIYKGQTDHLISDQEPLSWEKFPFVGLSKTYSVNVHTTDSASSATAFLSGIKAQMATIGVGPHVKRGDCLDSLKHKIDSIASWAIKEGKWSGFVTNTRVTHATPSSLYAHSADRDWEDDSKLINVTNGRNCKDIALQLIENFPGNNLRVIMGGGRRHFIPNTEKDFEINQTGLRMDGRNLIEEWKNHAFRKFVWNRTQLMNTDVDSVQYLMGLFDYTHMEYAYKHKIENRNDDPSLEEMTVKAIKMLSRNEDGYFLLVEGGRIDHALHQNWAKLALEEVKMFDKTVETARRLTNKEDTLIVVTADHSHSMNLIGYPYRNTSILGTFYGQDQTDGLPTTLLVFADGPSAAIHHPNGTLRRNLTEEDTEHYLFRQPALIPGTDDSHAGEDVGVYASGPMSHLFIGVIEQSYIAHAMAYALCIGVSKDKCLQQKQQKHVQIEKHGNGHSQGLLIAAVILLCICLILLLIITIITILRFLRFHLSVEKIEDSQNFRMSRTAMPDS